MALLDDNFDDPAPSPLTDKDRKNLKRRLPLRADVVVDNKKYKGQRVSRDDAEIASVEEEVLSDTHQENHSSEDEGSATDKRAQIANEPVSEGAEDLDDDDLNSDDNADSNDVSLHREMEARKEEKEVADRLAEDKVRETKRAAAVKQQKAVHDSVVDARIRLEQVLNVARGFPTLDDRADSEKWKSFDSSEAVEAKELKETVAMLEKLANQLMSSAENCVPESVDVSSNISFSQWRDSVLDKWGRKVNEAEGVTPKGGFKVIDTSISSQLRATMTSGKHERKSRKVRASIPLHGSVGDIEEGENELHYDDRELYRSLLQEIIESGNSSGGALKFAQLSKSGKVKKKIDRSGAKGRKLRYVVHEKLVGFLAPIPLPDPGPIDEILTGLFGVVN